MRESQCESLVARRSPNCEQENCKVAPGPLAVARLRKKLRRTERCAERSLARLGAASEEWRSCIGSVPPDMLGCFRDLERACRSLLSGQRAFARQLPRAEQL